MSICGIHGCMEGIFRCVLGICMMGTWGYMWMYDRYMGVCVDV